MVANFWAATSVFVVSWRLRRLLCDCGRSCWDRLVLLRQSGCNSESRTPNDHDHDRPLVFFLYCRLPATLRDNYCASSDNLALTVLLFHVLREHRHQRVEPRKRTLISSGRRCWSSRGKRFRLMFGVHIGFNRSADERSVWWLRLSGRLYDFWHWARTSSCSVIASEVYATEDTS